MNIYLCCPVRKADDKLRADLEAYVAKLEGEGHKVHYPARDTDQNETGFNICTQNASAIAWCDEFHVWFDPASTGSHFDLGAAFVLSKKLVIVHNISPLPEGKSFARMITEWEELSKEISALVKAGEDEGEVPFPEEDVNPSLILYLI